MALEFMYLGYLRDLDKVEEGMPNEQAQVKLRSALVSLNRLYDSKSPFAPYLGVSAGVATSLQKCLGSLLKSCEDQDYTITFGDVWSLNYFREDFMKVFLFELNTVPFLLVRNKELYDTGSMIDQGHKLFPSSLAEKVPKAMVDAMEAGKALAFDLPSACGFHTFRVVELATKEYWNHVAGGKKYPKPATIGRYSIELEQHQLGQEAVWQALRQLTTLHRNPLIHPGKQLTVGQAIDTLGIARSVISAMLSVLPEKKAGAK